MIHFYYYRRALRPYLGLVEPNDPEFVIDFLKRHASPEIADGVFLDNWVKTAQHNDTQKINTGIYVVALDVAALTENL